MWLLYRIWLVVGDNAHHEVFPELLGTWPGEIYKAMKLHYAEKFVRPIISN